MMDFTKFVEICFLAILTGGMTWVVRYLQKIATSISHLDTQVAVIINTTKWHERKFDELNQRLSAIEGHSVEASCHVDVKPICLKEIEPAKPMKARKKNLKKNPDEVKVPNMDLSPL